MVKEPQPFVNLNIFHLYKTKCTILRKKLSDKTKILMHDSYNITFRVRY